MSRAYDTPSLNRYIPWLTWTDYIGIMGTR